MIYILHPVDGGVVKIGTSDTPAARKINFDVAFPYGVELLATMEGGRVGEGFIHRCFAPIVASSFSLEWFKPRPVLWRFILSIIDGGRPNWLPNEDGFTRNEFMELAFDIWGSEEGILAGLGYAGPSDFKTVFQFRVSVAAQSRLAFEAAMRAGSVPDYIAELHQPEPALVKVAA